MIVATFSVTTSGDDSTTASMDLAEVLEENRYLRTLCHSLRLDCLRADAQYAAQSSELAFFKTEYWKMRVQEIQQLNAIVDLPCSRPTK